MRGLLEKIKLGRILNGLVKNRFDIYYGEWVLYDFYNSEYLIYYDDISTALGIEYKEYHYILLDYIKNNLNIYIRDFNVLMVNKYDDEISIEEYEKIIKELKV